MKKILLFIACCLFAIAYGQGSVRALGFTGDRVPMPGGGIPTEANPPAGVSISHSFLNNRAEYTWEAWVFNQSNEESWVYGEGNPQLTFAVGLGPGVFYVAAHNEGVSPPWQLVSIPTGAAVPTNEWAHFAVTRRNNGTTTLYINGVQVATGALHVQSHSATSQAAIGINPGFTSQIDLPFRGIVDEVRIWNRALTEDEIRHKMTERLTGSEPGLAAYYRMDQDACPGADVCDASGQNNHGVRF
ncbi:MAG: LamG domain-containing protein [Sphingobacteriia bacterium]|jgi:hypothetical protein|nr:LamG domain-containing protein [Flammeovirgaceae bacterium]